MIPLHLAPLLISGPPRMIIAQPSRNGINARPYRTQARAGAELGSVTRAHSSKIDMPNAATTRTDAMTLMSFVCGLFTLPL